MSSASTVITEEVTAAQADSRNSIIMIFSGCAVLIILLAYFTIYRSVQMIVVENERTAIMLLMSMDRYLYYY